MSIEDGDIEENQDEMVEVSAQRVKDLLARLSKEHNGLYFGQDEELMTKIIEHLNEYPSDAHQLAYAIVDNYPKGEQQAICAADDIATIMKAIIQGRS